MLPGVNSKQSLKIQMFVFYNSYGVAYCSISDRNELG